MDDPASMVPKQVSLPITKGGDGITDPRAIANAAFLGSWALWFRTWREAMVDASNRDAPTFTQNDNGTSRKTLSPYLSDLCPAIPRIHAAAAPRRAPLTGTAVEPEKRGYPSSEEG